MDHRQTDHDLSDVSAVGRWLLLAALFAVGCTYVAAFVFFVTHSQDFLERRFEEDAFRYACSHRSTIPVVFDLGPGRPDLQRLGTGWNAPEPMGIWTSDEEASLMVCVPPGQDLAIDVAFRSFVARRHPEVAVELLANAIPLARWEMRLGRDRVSERVPLSRAVIGDGRVKLTFRVDAPASPLSRRAGGDRRRLGVFVSRLSIEPGDAS